ncbi:MAG: HipA domain-containing protein [Bacteroidaceae bacterium]|nr:HipA domain-containing protein [Bacteroidaceae bacterium]MBR1903506.1 HipA domain-containing protein [Bacteroidaceae bacterium]
MIELSVCPSTLQEGFATYSPSARRQLFDGKEVSPVLDFDSPNNDSAAKEAYLKNVGRISLSGVQPKASLVLDAEGHLVKPDENERGTYILKPAPSSYALFDRKYCPANEHVTMQLASQVYQIETAVNSICFFRDGEAAYLCRRFDVGPDGQKYSQEDFASLAGLTNANGGSDFKYSNLSYEECADIIRRYVKAAPVEILKFFRIIVFNYLTLNDDAHLKNFSLINRGDGEYHLAPAYDLINTSLHLSMPRIFALDKGLFKEGMQLSDTKTVGRKDFEEFGRRIGLSERLIKRELNFFATEYPLAKELIDRSFLSESLKRSYWLSYNYRRITLTFS